MKPKVKCSTPARICCCRCGNHTPAWNCSRKVYLTFNANRHSVSLRLKGNNNNNQSQNYFSQKPNGHRKYWDPKISLSHAFNPVSLQLEQEKPLLLWVMQQQMTWQTEVTWLGPVLSLVSEVNVWRIRYGNVSAEKISTKVEGGYVPLMVEYVSLAIMLHKLWWHLAAGVLRLLRLLSPPVASGWCISALNCY